MDDEVVGTLSLVPSDPEIWPEADQEARYLHRLAVRRRWSGRRIGLQLLSWAAAEVALEGISLLRLDCPADSLVLPGYYERAGFVARDQVMFHDVFGNDLLLNRYEKQVSPSTAHTDPLPRGE
jgi:predicted N-acetyltransferase YhbS